MLALFGEGWRYLGIPALFGNAGVILECWRYLGMLVLFGNAGVI